MLVEIAVATAALVGTGALLAVRRRSTRSALPTEPPARPRTSFLELHDVLLVDRAQHCLVGEVVFLDGARPIRCLVDTYEDEAVWAHVADEATQALDVLRVTTSLGSGIAPDDLLVSGVRLNLERRCSARVELRGDAPPLTGPVRFSYYASPSGARAIILETPTSRISLLGERLRDGGYDVLPGK